MLETSQYLVKNIRQLCIKKKILEPVREDFSITLSNVNLFLLSLFTYFAFKFLTKPLLTAPLCHKICKNVENKQWFLEKRYSIKTSPHYNSILNKKNIKKEFLATYFKNTSSLIRACWNSSNLIKESKHLMRQ
jgi:hypothetical protein